MEIWGHLVCLNKCIRTAVSTCVVPMRFQSVMDYGQVREHGTLTERDADRQGGTIPKQREARKKETKQTERSRVN